jgi:hypothetical protein
MSEDVELGCRCGQLHGWARGAAPKAVHRCICYCDDCQAFLHFLERAELLDAHGGTDVVQVPPSMVAFDQGLERIAAMRMTSQGMYRWYASCCKTPLENTLTPSVPFIGMPLEIFRGAPSVQRIDEIFGKPRRAVMGKFAVGGAPEAAMGFPVGHIVHIVAKVFSWKLAGKTWPHPFFDKATRAPQYPVTILERAEREALRSRCGPNPKIAAKEAKHPL